MPASEPVHRVLKLKQCDKALKDKIRWICEWEASQGRNGYHQRVFEAHNISRSTGYRILREDPDPPPKPETRGRPSKVNDEDIFAIQATVEEHGWTSKSMTWDELAKQACNGEVSGQTLRRAMGTFDYHRCIICRRGWLNDDLAKTRVEFAHAMLQQRPNAHDWHDVVFSAETSWNMPSQGLPQLIRKAGEQYCRQCVEHKVPAEKKSKQTKVHSWAAVGVPLPDQRSELIFYDSGNSNGKMTASCYIDSVLEPVVKPWLRRFGFILSEDTDDSWALGINSTATKWRKEHRLAYYYNPKASPDLSPVHGTFEQLDLNLRTAPQIDTASGKAILHDAWRSLAIPMDEAVETMPARLRSCLELDGQFTGY